MRGLSQLACCTRMPALPDALHARGAALQSLCFANACTAFAKSASACFITRAIASLHALPHPATADGPNPRRCFLRLPVVKFDG